MTIDAPLVAGARLARTHAAVRPYVPIALLTPLIALVGFWATYYGPLLLTGTTTTPAIIQLHAAIFVGWLLLVIAQGALAATGRIALHVKVGLVGFAYGVLLIVIGVAATFFSFEQRLQAGDLAAASVGLFVGLTDMLTFAPFLAAAWFSRGSPEIHKRLIIVATTVLLIAPVHRMHWFLGRPAPITAILLIWLAPIYLGMIHDFVKRRLVHPVYLLGILAVVYMKFWRAPMARSETWRECVAWLAALST